MENVNSVAYVTKITEILPIEGADKIEQVFAGDWSCVAQKDKHKIGDLVIVATTDAIIPEELAENLQVTSYLRKGNRVRTVKLKSVYSECLIIPPSYIKYFTKNILFEGKDVMGELGVYKYEPPVKQITLSSGRKVRYQDNPNFGVYYKFPNIKNVPNMFTENDIVEVTRKIHGCFQGNTLISLYDGSKKKIKDIKVGDEVLGYDHIKDKIVKTKVLNTFNNGKTKEWLKISTTRTGSLGNHTKNVVCTPNHRFYVKRHGYVEANDLIVHEHIISYVKGKKLTNIQKSVLIGKMLGDGSLRKPNSGNFGVCYSHSEKQLEYLKYCYNILGDLSNQNIDTIISGYGSTMYRTNTCFDRSITELFDKWEINGIKEFPSNVKLDPISIAFWYMDDGSLSHSDKQKDRACFATNGFSEKSIDNLLKELNKFNIKGVKYNSKGWRIRLNKDDAEKLFLLIRKYIPDDMQYKLPVYHRGYFKPLDIQESNDFIYYEQEEIISEISQFYSSKMNTTKYDFETDVHNYFANEILVHNCNARYGVVKKKKLSLIDRIKKFFGNTWIEFEFVYGSHNVEKGSDSQGYYSTDVWKEIAEKYNIKERLWEYVKSFDFHPELLGNGVVLYGEIYGKGIQKGYEYGLDEILFNGFDVKLNDQYLSTEEAFNIITSDLTLEYVPILYVNYWNDKLSDKFVIDNFIGNTKVPHEGIVVKHITGDRRKVAKIINPAYLIYSEKNNIGDSH